MSKSPIVARINALLSLRGISKKQFLKIAKFLHLHFHNGIQEKSKSLEGKTLNG